MDIFSKGKKMVPKLNKSSWITLNVGGQKFLTTKHTLLSTDSIFRQLINDEPTESVPMYKPLYWTLLWKNRKKKPPQLNLKAYYQLRMKEDNLYYIDRDPKYFAPVLNFMRYKRLIRNYSVSLQGIMEEATYFQVTELIEYIEKQGISKPELPKDEPLYDDSGETVVSTPEFVPSEDSSSVLIDDQMKEKKELEDETVLKNNNDIKTKENEKDDQVKSR